jgi:hypothetical protein
MFVASGTNASSASTAVAWVGSSSEVLLLMPDVSESELLVEVSLDFASISQASKSNFSVLSAGV